MTKKDGCRSGLYFNPKTKKCVSKYKIFAHVLRTVLEKRIDADTSSLYDTDLHELVGTKKWHWTGDYGDDLYDMRFVGPGWSIVANNRLEAQNTFHPTHLEFGLSARKENIEIGSILNDNIDEIKTEIEEAEATK